MFYEAGTLTGGTGYEVGDVIYPVGFTGPRIPKITVMAINGSGMPTSWFVSDVGQIETVPSDVSAVSTTSSGSGTGVVVNFISLPGNVNVTTTSQAFPNKGLEHAKHYPAVNADSGWSGNYNGAAPMGGFLTIDPQQDLAADWTTRRTSSPTSDFSTYERLALFAAVQKYGAFICDTSNNTHNMFVASTDCPSARLDKMTVNNATLPYLKWSLLYVHNITPVKVPGSTLLASLPNDLYPING